MRKLLFIFLVLTMCGNVYSADQWAKTAPQGSASLSTIDTLLQTNNESLDRLLYNYRENLTVIPSSSSQVKVLAGEIGIPNSAGSIVKWRKNTSTTTVTWADIDTGAESGSTTYYLYALADTDATTCTFKVSTSSTSPSGATQYRKIGYFYNNASSNIVNVGNIKGGDVENIMQVVGTDDITTTSTSYVDMNDMEIKFVSTGRQVFVTFSGTFSDTTGNPQITFDIDGTDKVEAYSADAGGTGYFVLSLEYLEVLSSGTHTIKVQWKVESGTASQKGSSFGDRILTVREY